MTLSPEQLAERRNLITSSDASAILGVNPFRSRLEVYLDKRGMAPPEVIDAGRATRMKWGHLHEVNLRSDYAERNRVHVELAGTLRRPGTNHAATPDGLVSPLAGTPPVRGLECKYHTVGVRHLYGAEGTDAIPIHEVIQCQWGMHVHPDSLPRWDVVVLLDGLPRDYVIQRDDELIGEVGEACDRFWRDFVIKGRQPAPDGSDADTDLIKRLCPTQDPEMVAATEADYAIVELLKLARAEADAAARNKVTLEQKLKLRIGSFAGLQWGDAADQRITWKLSKSSTGVDWQAVAQEFATTVQLAACAPALRSMVDNLRSTGLPTALEAAAAFAQLIATISAGPSALVKQHTKITKAGSRRFLVPRAWKAAGEAGDADES